MPFSPETKQKARSASNYTCCWCHASGTTIHVHHIQPEAQGGTNDLDNAAVLCPNCHYSFGHQPGFESQMRERRNDWVAKIAVRYAPADPYVVGKLLRLDRLEAQNTISNTDVAAAISASGNLLPPSTGTPAEMATTGVVLSATAVLASSYYSYLGANRDAPLRCISCNSTVWHEKANVGDPCPTCGAPLVASGS